MLFVRRLISKNLLNSALCSRDQGERTPRQPPWLRRDLEIAIYLPSRCFLDADCPDEILLHGGKQR